MCKHPFWPALPGSCNYMEKNRPGETGFLNCKSEISVLKKIPPSWHRIISHVTRNVFLDKKDYLNGISSTYPAPAILPYIISI